MGKLLNSAFRIAGIAVFILVALTPAAAFAFDGPLVPGDMSVASLESAVVDISDQTYTGKPLEPQPTVRLEGAELPADAYNVSFTDNTNAGTATVTITGVEPYMGTATGRFTIKKASIAKATAAKLKARTYTGVAIKPGVKLTYNGATIAKKSGYTVKHANNKNAGRAKVTIKGTGNFKGAKTLRFTIKRASLASCTFAKIAPQTYANKASKPLVKATYKGRALKAGRDFMTAYRNNNAIGKATATVKGKGNFRGSKTLAFRLLDWVTPLKVAKKVTQLITVEVRGKRATVTLHEKRGSYWREVVRTTDGWIGRDGLGNAREGVDFTPRGVMYPDRAFGIKGDPGCPMGYLKVDWSHWWNGDSSSSGYNTLVSTRDGAWFDTAESEHLISCGPVYNYCLNMGWNSARTPHKGSAFFLHCSAGKPTGGCVSVPESTMVNILRHVKRGCAIAIDTRSRLKTY